MESSAEGTVVDLPITSPQPGIVILAARVWQRASRIKQVFIGGALIEWFAVEDRDRAPAVAA